MATSMGTVKKTALDEFSNPRKAGIIAVDLDAGDYLIGAALTDGKHDVMLFSDGGKAVRFDENDVRPMGRNARGVRGMTLEDGQGVIAMLVAEDEQQSVLTATENGYGKRTSITEYTRHGRGTKGMIAIQQSERNGKVVAATLVHADDEIMLITDKGVLVRTRVAEIRELGRATQGVTLIGLDEGAKLSGLQRIVENDANVDDRARRRRHFLNIFNGESSVKKIKLALLTVALAGSSLAMAQDKAALIKQFIDLQRPGIESLARGLVEQSSAPIAQAGSQYLQTQVPADKREAAAKAADAELKKYFDDAYPIVRDKAVQLAPGALAPDHGAELQRRRTASQLAGLDQLAAEQEVPGNQPQAADRADRKAGGRNPRHHRAEDGRARRQRRQGARRTDQAAAPAAAAAKAAPAKAPAKK